MTAAGSSSVFFDTEHQGDVTTVRVRLPRLTEEDNIEQMGHELFSLVEQLERRKIIVNLGKVEYVTSAVLGKFITLHRRLHRHQGRLFLCQIQPTVKDILDTSRLTDYFNVVENEAAARTALATPETGPANSA